MVARLERTFGQCRDEVLAILRQRQTGGLSADLLASIESALNEGAQQIWLAHESLRRRAMLSLAFSANQKYVDLPADLEPADVQKVLWATPSDTVPLVFLQEDLDQGWQLGFESGSPEACRVEATTGVIRVRVTVAGSGYVTAPTVAIAAPGNTQAQTATATAALLSGGVGSVAVTNAGQAYVSVPAVTFSGGSGSGAAAIADLGTVLTLALGPVPTEAGTLSVRYIRRPVPLSILTDADVPMSVDDQAAITYAAWKTAATWGMPFKDELLAAHTTYMNRIGRKLAPVDQSLQLTMARRDRRW